MTQAQAWLWQVHAGVVVEVPHAGTGLALQEMSGDSVQLVPVTTLEAGGQGPPVHAG